MAVDFLAGCLGGCAGVIVGHPLDTVKVHLQIQGGRNPQYRGTLHCIQTLVAKDGIRGIYRGISSPLAGVAAINAIIFGVYGNTQRRLSDPDALSSIFIAGASAGMCQSVLTSPIELAKLRVQVSGGALSPLQCLKTVYKYEGVRGVFKGLNTTVAREIPAFGCYFLSYECLTRTSDGSPISTGTMLIAGGLAGMASWIVSYPVDVIKSRLQLDGLVGACEYKNSFDCLKKSVTAEGYGCLFRGLSPALMRAFPVNAACFAVVTWTMRLLDSSEIIVESPSQDKTIWERYSDVVYNIQTPEIIAA